MKPIYLASTSPRRIELLQLLDIPFDLLYAPITETIQPEESVSCYVVRMALEKALAGVAIAVENRPVLGVDTCLSFAGEKIGKPKNRDDAKKILTQLSGQQHHVLTAIAFANKVKSLSKVVTTSIQFCTLTEQQINDYLNKNESMDKAGAYAIQGKGGSLIRSLCGSYHAVVGLPLVETRELYQTFIQHHKEI